MVNGTMTRDMAETIGLRALGWLAGEEELLPVFLGATGADMAELRTRAADPGFLGAVLDFLLMDDAWIVRFCDAQDLAYEVPRAARGALPGGEDRHWT
ncbi:DUF3572 domain-containing protein [Acidimangrovimonas sediminis]|uniref:DUF3572 domain-containing protein n=1 Tax=Acidimangrovimonas sediminis TaxID=2056283 RepID=UPI001E473BCB|nr:DUF3572 domain-containing protein [Acidimangrovimonas sediminis]